MKDIYMYDYYRDRGVRDICHGVKENDLDCIKSMAEFFINQDIIDKNSILIPTPQHIGHAVYTKAIAEIVAAETGAEMLDILRVKPHEKLYEQKLKGKIQDIYMFLSEDFENIEDKKIYLIDNVIATGTTFNVANKLFDGALKQMIFAKV